MASDLHPAELLPPPNLAAPSSDAAPPLTRTQATGSAAAGGLVAGVVWALLAGLIVTPTELTRPALLAGLLGLGATLGLGWAVGTRLLRPEENPGYWLARWLSRGPVGVGDRAVGLLGAALAGAHLFWTVGSWVDRTFHHLLLSAALLTACLFLLSPLLVALGRLLERLSSRIPELALLLLVGGGVALGLRLAWTLTPGALTGPLLLGSGAMLALAGRLLVLPHARLCRIALPLTLLLALALPLLTLALEGRPAPEVAADFGRLLALWLGAG